MLAIIYFLGALLAHDAYHLVTTLSALAWAKPKHKLLSDVERGEQRGCRRAERVSEAKLSDMSEVE